MRLGDHERSEIRSGFGRVAQRAKNNKVFPLVEEDFPEFGYSMLDPRIAGPYEFLREHASELTSAAAWNPDFKIRDATHVYEIEVHGVTLPKEHLLLPDNHPKHAVLIKWAKEQWDIDQRVSNALYYLHEIVETCSSTGQIKRVLQDEILRFVPEYMHQSLGNAERKSRVPAGLTVSPERLNDLANILALGSLSPKDRQGLSATVDDRTDI